MNDSANWYASLEKPFFSPPAWIFGPVWSALYLVIAISFGYVAYLAFKKKIRWSVFLPFGLNLVFNATFTPLQFGLKSNILAAVDILLVLSTLVWALLIIWRTARWVALVNLPYLAWVSFATVLQLSITWLNM